MEPKFDEKGLICAVAQDARTGKVLMQAYMNKEALDLTVKTGRAHYWSRSRARLWRKGEESGHVQTVKELSLDCDGDCVLLKVEQVGPACHTGSETCFFNLVNDGADPRKGRAHDLLFGGAKTETDAAANAAALPASILYEMARTVKERAKTPEEGSYTNYLLDKGVDKICKKVGEEAAETIIAAKNADNTELSGELADLFYHVVVLCENRGLDLDAVFAVLKERHSAPRKREYGNK
ncbi:histidine biosynthesis bifunctional protein HisIE [Clostridia bacterium]|nr:histidine biosynthesis bifunctional protein HisIE [Clostridia bacterium]